MSAGIKIAPTANVVATDEPETAAKIMQVSTQVMGRPPCTPPTMLLANSTSLREIPPVSIRLPARMKNGIAANGNLLMALNISLTEISMLALLIWMPTTEARPMETATEMVSAKHRTMVVSMTALMSRFPVLHVAGPAGWQRCPSRRKHRLWAWRHNPRTWTATPVRPCFARGRAVRSPNPTR